MVKNLVTKKTPGIGDFTGECHQTFQEGIIPILHSLLEIEEEVTLPKSFYKASIILFPKPDKGITRRENYRPISS